MPLDPLLLEMLACPAPDHGTLVHDAEGQSLTCTSCGRVFPVQDNGLPVLLFEEEPDDAVDYTGKVK